PAGDDSLAPGGPGVNAGTASLAGQAAPATDVRFYVRPSGAGYDLGAYEYLQGAAVPTTTLTGPAAGNVGQTLIYLLGVSDPGPPGARSCTSHTFGGAGSAAQTVTGANGPLPTHAFPAAGWFAVVVPAPDPSGHTGPATPFSTPATVPAGGGTLSGTTTVTVS